MEPGLLEEGQGQADRKHPTASFLDPASDPLLSAATTAIGARATVPRTSNTHTYTHHTHTHHTLAFFQHWLLSWHCVFSLSQVSSCSGLCCWSTETSEEPLVDLSDVLSSDTDLLGMLGKSATDHGMCGRNERIDALARVHPHQ